MINNVTLTGRLTADPKIKDIKEDVKVANFTLAVNRMFSNEQGEKEADFINVVAWNRQAEFLEKYIVKGQLIGVVGSIQTRTYEKEGQTFYVTEINARDIISLEYVAPRDEESIKKTWQAEWDRKSKGLNAKEKEALKKELVEKSQPQIDALTHKLNSELPF